MVDFIGKTTISWHKSFSNAVIIYHAGQNTGSQNCDAGLDVILIGNCFFAIQFSQLILSLNFDLKDISTTQLDVSSHFKTSQISWKISTYFRRIVDSFLSIWKNETVSYLFDISHLHDTVSWLGGGRQYLRSKLANFAIGLQVNSFSWFYYFK